LDAVGHDSYAGRYRDLAGWTRALTFVSVLTLGAHAARAVLGTAVEFIPTSADGPLTWLPLAGLLLDLALKALFLASAATGLAWLYRANVNAHALSPGTKYSPIATVGWFFVPALNILYSFGVVYEVWARSGGPRRAAIIITWWGFTVWSMHLFVLWAIVGKTNLFASFMFGGSTLLFLLIARRIQGFQRSTAIAAEFHDSGEVREDGTEEEPWVRPPGYTKIETVEQPRSAPLPVASAQASRGSQGAPGVVMVKRPFDGPPPRA